jgi:hypothetical protein
LSMFRIELRFLFSVLGKVISFPFVSAIRWIHLMRQKSCSAWT